MRGMGLGGVVWVRRLLNVGVYCVIGYVSRGGLHQHSMV